MKTHQWLRLQQERWRKEVKETRESIRQPSHPGMTPKRCLGPVAGDRRLSRKEKGKGGGGGERKADTRATGNFTRRPHAE